MVGGSCENVARWVGRWVGVSSFACTKAGYMCQHFGSEEKVFIDLVEQIKKLYPNPNGVSGSNVFI